MNLPVLPNRAEAEETCVWLAAQTGSPWNLARLLEHGLTPYVWLDYTAEHADLFADGITGYPAPIFFVDDIKHLAEGNDVLLRLTRDSDSISIKLHQPIRLPLSAVRFLQRDIARLADDILNPKAPEAPPAPMREVLKGISRDEVLDVFGGMAKLDLERALADAIGIFGDDGARVRKNSRAGKNTHLWNPVTLALGLNDVHRVPMSRLKKTFATHPLLRPWLPAWLESLALLGE